MPPALPADQRRVNLILFADDVALLERRYGRGWTSQIRRMVHENCQQYKKYQAELNEYLEKNDGRD